MVSVAVTHGIFPPLPSASTAFTEFVTTGAFPVSVTAYGVTPSAAAASGTGIAATVIAEISSITADVFLIRLLILLSSFFLTFPNIKIHLLLSCYDIGATDFAPECFQLPYILHLCNPAPTPTQLPYIRTALAGYPYTTIKP